MFTGVNPESLRGSNTGVFVGAQGSESQTVWTTTGGEIHPGYILTGSALAMFSNRLSFALDFTGNNCCYHTLTRKYGYFCDTNMAFKYKSLLWKAKGVIMGHVGDTAS